MSTAGAQRRANCAAQVFVDDVGHPVLTDSDRHHLVKVRRLRDGEEVVASDGRGNWRVCVMSGEDLDAAGELEFEERSSTFGVAMAPVKGDRSEWAVAKLTELGVASITALITERGAVRWDAHQAHKVLERWRRVSVEAACQSRQVHLPTIEGPLRVSDLKGPGVAMAALGGAGLTQEVSTILVGPEGGWSDEELSAGFDRVELAGGVLRTETAAVVAGALLGWLRGGTVPLSDIR